MSISYSSCPPSRSYVSPNQKYCPEHNDSVLNYILHNKSLKTIVIATYFNLYLRKHRDGFETGLAETVKQLLAADRHVVIMAPPPEPGFFVPQTAAKFAIFGRQNSLSMSITDYLEREAEPLAIVRRLAALPNVSVIDPVKQLCDATSCPLVVEGHPILFDDNHLSTFAAAILAGKIDIGALF